jgi:DNA polymerase
MDGKTGKPRAKGVRGRALKQRLESLAAAGVSSLPAARGRRRTAAATDVAGSQQAPGQAAPDQQTSGRKSPVKNAAAQDSPAREAAPAAAATPVPATAAHASRQRDLEVLRDAVSSCRLCEPLARARTHTVFGAGPATARICFLGEAPGADEDASGQPFVGRAGQLLTKIIEACTLSRDEVYILNVLKCRPPDNRPPLPEETAHCRGYFERQLEIIGPEFICCLGTTAAQALLQTDETIGKLRKRWFSWRSSRVICTYHPSYLLRNPSAKREVWDDMILRMAQLGVEL